jgi:hypothetical protein
LPALAASAQLRSPTLLVVGQVATLAQVGTMPNDIETAATKQAH